MLDGLFENNRAWAERMNRENPGLFERLALQQAPQYLWIGCADSRVPASQILGVGPGELFVHRNIGNTVVHTDLNCLSVLQYAVDILKIKDVMVCGHYECGGIRAALNGHRYGLIDNWLSHIREVFTKHKSLLTPLSPDKQIERMCELNVAEQVLNVCQSSVMADVWRRGEEICVHGLIYSIRDGLINAPMLSVKNLEETQEAYNNAIEIITLKCQH